MAAKLFSSSEEPDVDDFPQGEGVSSNTNNSMASSAHNDDSSWGDVKKIFETFNKQLVTAQASNQSQQQKILIENKKERLLSKSQSNKLVHFKTTKGVDTMKLKTVENVQSEELNSNKENTLDSVDQSRILNNSIHGSRNNSEHIKSLNILTPSVSSCTTVSTYIDNSKQTARSNDQTNRVRQVNVEMFTVTLKHGNLPKDEQVRDNA